MGKIHCRITRRHGVSGTDQQIDCLRATISPTTGADSQRLGDDATRASSINNIDMAGALEAVKTYLVRYLTAGEIVRLDGIGSFQLSIGLKQMLPADAKVTAKQVEVKGLTFRPAENLMTDIRKDVSFVIDEDKRDHATPDEAVDLLRSYFATCRQEHRSEFITIKRFAALTACCYSTANHRVKRLVADGLLIPSAEAKYCYLPGPKLQPTDDNSNGTV